MTAFDAVSLGIVLSVVAAVCLALTSLTIRLGTNNGRSSDALVVVLLVNIVTFVPLALWIAHPGYSISLWALFAFIAAGIVGTLLARILYYASIERIGASRSEPIKASQPLHATVIAVVLLEETVSIPHLLGILLIICGVAIISIEMMNASVDPITDPSWSTLAFPFAAAFFFGLEPIFASIGFETGASVFVGLALKTMSAAVGFFAYLGWKGALSVEPFRASASRRWYLAAGGANTLFLFSYYTALEIAPVSVVVPILQTSPIFVVLMSAAFLQRYERVTSRLIGMTLIVVSGSVLVTLFS
ncbi:DMT family transporter [Natrinema gelatinilyticum]|uniref:DMT family transporter n=1 Tax=Natrinema gelatinilyticum TaxID=2961571 RepID=UPI0020C1E3B7|nr:EamA family transporter [Natrinema gelatinilyticum]